MEDYARFDLEELLDAADHVDRRCYPEIAAAIEAEIKVKAGSKPGEPRPWTTLGAAKWGDTFLDAHVTWPFARLTCSQREISLTIEAPMTRTFLFAREQVLNLRDVRHLLMRGVQIVHAIPDYPPCILFSTFNQDELCARFRLLQWSLTE